MAKFDGGKIEAVLDLDRTPFNTGLDKAIADGERFAAMRFTATLDYDVDDSALNASPDTSTITRKVVYDDNATPAAPSDSTSNANVNTAVASAQVARLQAQLDALDRSNPEVDVRMGRGINTSRIGLGLLITAVSNLVAAAIPVAGVLVGAVGGLGTAFTGAGIAAGIFGVGAVGHLGRLATAMKKAKDEGTELPDKFKEGAEAVDELGDAWSDFLDNTDTQFFSVMALGVEILSNALDKLDPTFNLIAAGVERMLTPLNEWIKGSGFDAFLNWVGTNGVFFMESFGRIIGDVALGIGGLMSAFTPYAKEFMLGFEGMADSFRKWGQSLAESERFQQFIQYVRDNVPLVTGFISAAVGAATHLLTALAPLGGLVLTGLTSFLNFIREMDPTVLGAVATGVLGLVTALNAWRASVW